MDTGAKDYPIKPGHIQGGQQLNGALRMIYLDPNTGVEDRVVVRGLIEISKKQGKWADVSLSQLSDHISFGTASLQGVLAHLEQSGHVFPVGDDEAKYRLRHSVVSRLFVLVPCHILVEETVLAEVDYP